MRCLDHCKHKWAEYGVEMRCDREEGHTGVHAAMHPSEGRICVCPKDRDGSVDTAASTSRAGRIRVADSPLSCFHCGRHLVDTGPEDPNVDRLELTMRIQKWSLDVAVTTYMCSCGANTTRLGTVTAAYHDTWNREFGD
jgi:hypothetical protein